MNRLTARCLLAISLFFALSLSNYAQVPETYNYQALARDNNTGEPLQNTQLNVRIAILSSVGPDVVLWEEEHTLLTNEFGLFTLQVGNPLATYVSGSAGSFAAIDWSSGNFYIRPSVMQSGGSWQIMPASKLISVPFAMLAKDTENKQQLTKSGDLLFLSEGGSVDLSGYVDPDQSLVLSGNTLTLSNGGSVDLSGFDNPPQTISKSGNTVSLDGGGGSISLGEYVNQFEADADTLFRLNGSLVLGSQQAGRSKLAVVSNDDASEDALFEVKRADGQTVFAVYPEAVRMYVAKGDPQAKAPGTRGGFAVAGFDRNKATPLNDLLWLTPDSVRFYIDDSVGAKAPGTRGGFAVAGFDPGKGDNKEFLRVTSDSTRVYVKYLDKNGGFAVEGFADTVSSPQKYLNMDQNNSFVGLQAGANTIPEPGWITGINNSFIGFKSGFNNVYGINNVFIGHQSGYNNLGTTFRFGSNNILVGSEVGFNNKFGTDNIMIGTKAGYSNVGSDDIFSPAGNDNVYIGQLSGYSNIDGLSNVYIGERTGESDLHGRSNTFIGSVAGRYFTGGRSNVFLGDAAGHSLSSGDYNIIIGYNSGPLNPTSMSNNIFIGTNSGRGETGNNKLYIENSNATKVNSLIYGDFANNLLTFNANVGIGVLDSDVRLKVEGGSDVTLANGAGFLQLGSNSSLNMVLDQNEIQARSSGEASNLNLQNEGGTLTVGGPTILRSYLNVSGSQIIGNAATPTNVKLSVYTNSPAGGYAAQFINKANNSNAFGIMIQAGQNSPSAGIYQHLIHCYDGDGTYEGGLLLVNGTLTLYQSSDARRKANIRNSSLNGLNIINELRVVDFNFKEGPSDIQTGFIAQEAHEVFPDMVIYDESKDYYGISTGRLVPVLTKAIQEEHQRGMEKDRRIMELEAENAVIKARLDVLESAVNSLLGK